MGFYGKEGCIRWCHVWDLDIVMSVILFALVSCVGLHKRPVWDSMAKKDVYVGVEMLRSQYCHEWGCTEKDFWCHMWDYNVITSPGIFVMCGIVDMSTLVIIQGYQMCSIFITMCFIPYP